MGSVITDPREKQMPSLPFLSQLIRFDQNHDAIQKRRTAVGRTKEKEVVKEKKKVDEMRVGRSSVERLQDEGAIEILVETATALGDSEEGQQIVEKLKGVKEILR